MELSLNGGMTFGKSIAVQFFCFLLFILCINEISDGIESGIHLFADDCVCCQEMKGTGDIAKLQNEINIQVGWVRKWHVRFTSVKCKMMQLR